MKCWHCSWKAFDIFAGLTSGGGRTRAIAPLLQLPKQPPLQVRSFAQSPFLRRTNHESSTKTDTSKPLNHDRKEQPQPAESKQKEPWQIQKEALKNKIGSEGWKPRKRLSPEALQGIRGLHASDPEKFSTPVLAEQFKVSPEAIRRILKSKWQPTEEEQEERIERWEKRGKRIWSHLAEIGAKPPKKWREAGVGRAPPGQAPKWKRRGRWDTKKGEEPVPWDAGSVSARLQPSSSNSSSSGWREEPTWEDRIV